MRAIMNHGNEPNNSTVPCWECGEPLTTEDVHKWRFDDGQIVPLCSICLSAHENELAESMVEDDD